MNKDEIDNSEPWEVLSEKVPKVMTTGTQEIICHCKSVRVARLIASAPQMLIALKELKKELLHTSTPLNQWHCDLMDDAIEQAERK